MGTRKKTRWNNRKNAVVQFECDGHVITVREVVIVRRGRKEKVTEIDAPSCFKFVRVKT